MGYNFVADNTLSCCWLPNLRISWNPV